MIKLLGCLEQVYSALIESLAHHRQVVRVHIVLEAGANVFSLMNTM